MAAWRSIDLAVIAVPVVMGNLLATFLLCHLKMIYLLQVMCIWPPDNVEQQTSDSASAAVSGFCIALHQLPSLGGYNGVKTVAVLLLRSRHRQCSHPNAPPRTRRSRCSNN
jgi:hypothetical protein